MKKYIYTINLIKGTELKIKVIGRDFEEAHKKFKIILNDVCKSKFNDWNLTEVDQS